jgi:hypothetical protein
MVGNNFILLLIRSMCTRIMRVIDSRERSDKNNPSPNDSSSLRSLMVTGLDTMFSAKSITA